MAWTDAYIDCSFRGVPFFLKRGKQDGGRKLVKHDLVEQDDFYIKDRGRKNKTFSISGYVIGDDYYSQRDDLIEALDKDGTGIFINPYRGDLEVRVDSFSVSEDSDEGRMARFDITFEWIRDEALIIIGIDAGTNLLDKKRDLLDKIQDAFADAYEIANKPNEIIQDGIDVMNKGLDTVAAGRKVVSVYDNFQRKMDTIRGKIEEIGLQGRALAQSFQEILEFGSDPTVATYEQLTVGDTGKEQYYEFDSSTKFDDESLSGFPSIEEDDPNYPTRLIQKMIARTALTAKVGLIVNMSIDNVSEANDIWKDINTQIKKIEDDENLNIDYYDAARDLRVAVEKVIEERKLTLDRLVQIQVPENEPVLVTAYDLYNDTSRDEEIVNLNGIIHPGFMPGMQDLSVNEN